MLALLPPYFSQAVISSDPETGELGDTAVIAFGIKVMPFDEQKELIDAIRAEIDPPGTGNDPPAGVSAEVVGPAGARRRRELGARGQSLSAHRRRAARGRPRPARRLPLACAGRWCR